MTSEITIISAPGANEEQLKNLVYAIEAEGNLSGPVYVSTAKLNSFTKDDVLDWLETLLRICAENNWDLKDRK